MDVPEEFSGLRFLVAAMLNVHPHQNLFSDVKKIVQKLTSETPLKMHKCTIMLIIFFCNRPVDAVCRPTAPPLSV